jgi:glycosyltransferase involved in cell wall biosynthesis
VSLTSSPLAICHVLWSVELGGAERVVLDLAKAQRAAGHHVSVVTLSDVAGKMAAEFQPIVDTLEAVPKRAGTDVRLPFDLARWFRAHRTQVVHTHNELPLIYAAPGGKLARTAVVHSKHGIVPVPRRAHWLRRAAATATDVFVAVSAATADVARANHECPDAKLRIVVNGTDLSRFPAPAGARESIRNELGIPLDARVLVTIGRLVKEKDHALLLRSVARLLRPDVRVVIVGDGPLRDELHALAKTLPGREYIHLTGARRDVPALLASADAYVLSSASEGLPIGLLEAWAAGLPVVATSVGGIPAAVRHDKTGILVAHGDEAALGKAIARVLEGGDAVRAMAAQGRTHVLATYSSDRMASAYFDLYTACLRS